MYQLRCLTLRGGHSPRSEAEHGQAASARAGTEEGTSVSLPPPPASLPLPLLLESGQRRSLRQTPSLRTQTWEGGRCPNRCSPQLLMGSHITPKPHTRRPPTPRSAPRHTGGRQQPGAGPVQHSAQARGRAPPSGLAPFGGRRGGRWVAGGRPAHHTAAPGLCARDARPGSAHGCPPPLRLPTCRPGRLRRSLMRLEKTDHGDSRAPHSGCGGQSRGDRATAEVPRGKPAPPSAVGGEG